MGKKLGQKYKYENCEICEQWKKGICLLQERIDENDSDIAKNFLPDKCKQFLDICSHCYYNFDFDELDEKGQKEFIETCKKKCSRYHENVKVKFY